MKLDIESLRDLYRMNNMVRYNPWAKINSENVAAHSYYTALFSMLICKEVNASIGVKLAAYEIALLHDTPEIVINDITHDAKERMPGIDELLAKFEKKFIAIHFSDWYAKMFDDHIEDYRAANVIVRLADIISVVQYCDNEVLLGNIRFLPLLDDARLRVEEQKQKLERMGLKCQKIMI